MSNLIPENFPPHKQTLVKAILKLGNKSKFASAIGVSRQSVSGWLYNCKLGVPAKYCKKIEEVTLGNVTRSQLRPDIYGKPETKKPSNKEKLAVCISLLEEVSNNLKNKKGR